MQLTSAQATFVLPACVCVSLHFSIILFFARWKIFTQFSHCLTTAFYEFVREGGSCFGGMHRAVCEQEITRNFSSSSSLGDWIEMCDSARLLDMLSATGDYRWWLRLTAANLVSNFSGWQHWLRANMSKYALGGIQFAVVGKYQSLAGQNLMIFCAFYSDGFVAWQLQQFVCNLIKKNQNNKQPHNGSL